MPRAQKTEERLIGIGDVSRDEEVVMHQAVYRLIVAPDGSVVGEIRAPGTQRLTPWVAWHPGDWLQLRLEDGRQVFFQLLRAQSAPGGWGDVEGRVGPTR
jgi:hypothetical protein